MQLNIYLCTFSSTCFGLIRPSSGAIPFQNTGKTVAYSRGKFEASDVAACKLVAISDRFDCQPEMNNKFDKKVSYRILRAGDRAS